MAPVQNEHDTAFHSRLLVPVCPVGHLPPARHVSHGLTGAIDLPLLMEQSREDVVRSVPPGFQAVYTWSCVCHLPGH